MRLSSHLARMEWLCCTNSREGRVLVVLRYEIRNYQLSYRLRNWREYNVALIQRGSLTTWVSKGAFTARHGDMCVPADQAYRARIMINAILCMTWFSTAYQLPLPAIHGLVASVLNLLKAGLPVPAYTTLCRRHRKLEVYPPHRAQALET